MTTVIGSSRTVSISVASALATAAGGLSAGSWTTFTGPPTAIGTFGISWQGVTAWWDAGNLEFQFSAKAQSGGAYSHWIYSAATDSWRSTTTDLIPGALGHVWNVGFDINTGDYYYLAQNASEEFVRYMDRSAEAGAGQTNSPWTQTATATPDDIRGGSPEGCVHFHPNLYGSGDGGLILWGLTFMSAWRQSTDTWTRLAGYGGSASPYWSQSNGGGIYLPGYDRLVMGTGFSASAQSPRFMVVEAGSGGSLEANSPNFALHSPPAAVEKVINSTSAALPWGKLVVDPANDSRLMILEAGPPHRVWTDTSGGEGPWALESYTHPFAANLPLSSGDAGSWTVGHCLTYGVLWGMAYNGTTSQSILWKPDN